MLSRSSSPGGRMLAPLAMIGALAGASLVLGLLAVVIASLGQGDGDACGGSPQTAIALDAPGAGAVVGATEYGGPGDSSSGVLGARGDDLRNHPDSYAELGGLTWESADAMGGLPYLTPLRITWGQHSVIAFKRDFGFGGGPIDGRPRVIDLWWQLAGRLGIPYENGQWSGAVRVQRLASGGAEALLMGDPATPSSGGAGCGDPLSLVPGQLARLQPDGLAAAPVDAPPAVQAMIAAGNGIAGRPYVYGGAHALPLSELAPSYDCSSSVEHLLYAAGLIPVGYTVASAALESFGAPGPGRWVTIYASGEHVFMYVAGLRWDTHDAAGPGDGSSGIGWHPLVRSAAGFVARHPVGL